MTHSLVTVMVEAEHQASREAVERRVAELMSMYDENLKVPPYAVECSCRLYDADWRRRDEPGPAHAECEDCHGSGTHETTYNPQSKWDYYLPYDDPRGGWKDHVVGEKTYAVLTPEGGWQAQGHLGWFGSRLNERDDWDEKFQEILALNTRVGAKPFVYEYHI